MIGAQEVRELSGRQLRGVSVDEPPSVAAHANVTHVQFNTTHHSVMFRIGKVTPIAGISFKA